MTIIQYTVTELQEGLAKKQFSSLEITEAYLAQIESCQKLNAFITVTADHALAAARAADQRRWSSTQDTRALEGIPLGIKDFFCTAGIRTTAASHILHNFIPPYESTVTANLLAEGAFCIGKTNADAFGMGSTNLNSDYGPCFNPWKQATDDKPLIAGGSSGGSAVAVAGLMAPAALGTDTGGSVRLPASFCGLVGFKPTYGRCSRFGITSYASSLDQAGILTHTVQDAALLMRTMAGHDPQDATSSFEPVPDYASTLHDSIRGKVIGIPKEAQLSGMRDDVKALWETSATWLREQGAEVIEVSWPHMMFGLPTYYILSCAEASSNLSRYDGIRFGLREAGHSLNEIYEATRAKGFGAEVRRRIMMGTFVLSAGHYDAYYRKAQQVRRLLINDTQEIFRHVDALLLPTAANPAFALGEEPKDPITTYLNDIFTVSVSLAGLPAISLPAGLSTPERLPLGMQLVGKPFGEGPLLNMAQKFFEAANFPRLTAIPGRYAA
jgi:aspartyl-tRNA(Asn)/glutamyl-tRNA(Gln) amidotransferase subunit A